MSDVTEVTEVPESRVRPLFQSSSGSSGERAVRLPFRLPVFFREKRRLRADAQGVVVNVSETGLYVAIRHPPGIHDIVLLSIPGELVDGDSRSLRIRGQVRWWRTTRSRADESLGFGVKILDFGSPEHQGRYLGMVRRLMSAGAEKPGDESCPPRE